MSISLSQRFLSSFVSPHELEYLQPFVTTAHHLIHNKEGPGNEFLGWVNLPSKISKQEVNAIKQTAEKIRQQCDIFFVIGIGGSYLGSAAAIEFLKTSYHNQLSQGKSPEIYFVGNSISESQLQSLITYAKDKDICLNVISKSGTTTEPAISFRFLRKLLEEKYGDAASERITVTTDGSQGALKTLASMKGYETFVIPDDVGGRFSVLTPVGLLPIAVAGGDIDALLAGGVKAELAYSNPSLKENPSYAYAAYRSILKNKGKDTEVLVAYEPQFRLFGEWFKQLFGESEGKDGKGLFPTSMIFSTDLHSLGQFVQDGRRNLFETVLNVTGKTSNPSIITKDAEDFDGLNYLEGKTLGEINEKAMIGTMLAHVQGGVPNMLLTIPDMTEDTLGQLFYFFEKACAISGYLLGINPFDQPGVEDYKTNMFALLGKPGYEAKRDELEKLYDSAPL